MPVCHQGYHILYANDLPDSHQGNETVVCLFADDTKLSRVLSTIGDRFELQEGLNDFMNWAEQWQLRVAEHKCLVLSHGNCDAPGYYLKDVNLDNVDYHKDLGVIVDNHCLFKQHVSYICKKAYCSTNVLFRCFHTANTAALIRGYKSFIRPVLEYCSTVWNPYIHARHFIGMTTSWKTYKDILPDVFTIVVNWNTNMIIPKDSFILN